MPVTLITSPGSSPLVRGQLLGYVLSRDGRRIIPARAGPTSGYVAGNHRCPDHPRSCGANHIASVGQWFQRGSSPLVRGQPCAADRMPCHIRIIPARAGPTRLAHTPARYAPDHPRSCGANTPPTKQPPAPNGSSPLVRGEHSVNRLDKRGQRIIPARAGPTTLPKTLRLRKADHPRSCGANVN